jgi:hypothetical protein
MHIENEVIELSPAPKWYELILALIPFLFSIIWGNVPALFAIFPVISGALGGGLSALCALSYLALMKKTDNPLHKILIGLAGASATIFALYIVAIFLPSMI